MKRELLILGMLITGLWGCMNGSAEPCPRFSESQVMIGTASFSVAVADTESERERGLSGCGAVPEKSGIYFQYARPTAVRFWMKGMRVPIDMVWIRDGRVIAITPHVPLESDPQTPRHAYSPDGDVDAVLEIGAGAAARHLIRVGSQVHFQR